MSVTCDPRESTAVVRNEGYQPTELAVRRGNDRAVPVEWLVRAPNGGNVTVVGWHPKGGRAAATVNVVR